IVASAITPRKGNGHTGGSGRGQQDNKGDRVADARELPGRKGNYPNDHGHSAGKHDHTPAPPHVWIVATDLSVKPWLATKVARRPVGQTPDVKCERRSDDGIDD